MKHATADGLVINAYERNGSVYLSVLTADEGRMTLLAKGAKSIKNDQMSVSQLYTYANFEYYTKGDANILKGGSVHRSFFDVSDDLSASSLASYLCELATDLTGEGEEAREILRLLLNSLHALTETDYPLAKVKAAFELRAATLSGYAPDVGGCAICGSDAAKELYLDVMNGSCVCSDCRAKRNAARRAEEQYEDLREADLLCRLTPSAYAAFRYVTEAPLSRLLAFDLVDPEDARLFFHAAEVYLLSHLGHGFRTLDFYKTVAEL